MPAQLQGGDLVDKITVQRLTRTVSGNYNEPREAWSALVTIRAKRADASGVELLRAQEVGAQLTTRFTVRSSSVTRSVTPLDRIKFGEQTYNITAVREKVDMRRHWIEIDAAVRADK